MATNYPASLDTFTNPTSTDALDSVSVPHAGQHDNLNDAVLAIETELGVAPSDTYSTVKARLDSISPSAGILTASASISSSSTTGAIAYGALSYSDVNHLETLVGDVNAYVQVELQNKNAGASASADLIVANNATTASASYGDFGINSSGFSGTGSLALPNAVYLYATSGELVLGTSTANGIRFVVNSGATDALEISSTGTITALGQIIPATGTTSLAPFKFVTGVNLTSAVGGSYEYDGKVLYFTPDSSAVGGRGVVDTSLFASVAGTAKALTSATGNQPIFATPTTGALTVAGATTYLFDGYISLATGTTTTRTTSFNFGGTATITSIRFRVMHQAATVGTTGTSANYTSFAAATGGVINATNLTAASWFEVKGMIRVNASGTLIPQIAFSAAPGGTNTVGIDSFMRFTPVGSNTVVSAGAWA